MSGQASRVEQRAEDLRRSFDRSFAEVPSGEAAPHEDFIAIRMAADPYAIRLSEISGLFVVKTVTPLPGSVPELLGVAGFRGTIVPVYDLRVLMGYSGSERLRWLVLVSAPSPVGLAFDQFEGHLRVPRNAVRREQTAENGSKYWREVVGMAEAARAVVDLPSVVEAITKLARSGAKKEFNR